MATPALNPLVEKVRGAHPGAYDDMDDAALTKAVLAKYPQYEDLARPATPMPGSPATQKVRGDDAVNGTLTSAATQIANTPANVGHLILAKHWPIIDAKNFSELGQDIRSLNPIRTNEGKPVESFDDAKNIDFGASAVNVAPMAMKGAGILRDIDLPPKVKAVGKLAVEDAASHVPGIGRIVRRPSIMDYVKAAKTSPETPTINPGAPEPTMPSEIQQSGGLRTGGKAATHPSAALEKIPVEQSGDILRQRVTDAAPQSPLDRFRNQELPPESTYTPERPSIERILSPIESGPEADPLLERLRGHAEQIAKHGHGDEEAALPEESTPITTHLNDDLGPALRKSLAKVLAEKRRTSRPN